MIRIRLMIRCALVALIVSGVISGSPAPKASATFFPWPVNPETIKGLTLWLDASDMDADGNYGNNPAHGSTVDTWRDKSGFSRNATLVPGQNTGTYVADPTAGINGQPTVRFNRVNDAKGSAFRVPDVDIRASRLPNVTIFSVYRPRTVVANNGVWGADNGNWDRFFLSYHPRFGNGKTDGVASLGAGQWGATVDNAGVSGSVRLATIVYDGLVKNGVNQGPTDGSAAYFDGKLVRRFTDSTHPTDAQSAFAIGWDGDNSVFDGDIAEVIIYNRVLTDEEIRDVNHYFSEKYSFKVESPKTVPGKPVNLSSVCDATSATVSFTSGAQGSSPITNFEYSLDGGRTWIPVSPVRVSSPIQIQGLASGVVHEIVVRAVNEVGVSEASESASCSYNPPTATSVVQPTVAQPTVPDAPLNLDVTELRDMFQVAFDDGYDGGSPITHYQYSVDGGEWKDFTPVEKSSPVTFDNLKADRKYVIRIRAVNIVGAGAPSKAVTITGQTTDEEETISAEVNTKEADGASSTLLPAAGSGLLPVVSWSLAFVVCGWILVRLRRRVD